MLTVSEEVRNLFKTDRLPLTDSLPTKLYYIEVISSGTIIDMAHLESESLIITESICSDQELVFGRCESSSVSFCTYNISESLIGKQIRVYMTINGTEIPLGYYVVASEVKRSGAEDWKDIIAYDKMTDLDHDVTDWYRAYWMNRKTSTVRALRNSFFSYLGWSCFSQTLVNDNLTITNGLDLDNEGLQLSGRQVAEAIGEINACFGHIGRTNVFRWVYLPSPAIGLYPADDLYPAETLYPIEAFGGSDSSGGGSESVSYSAASYFPDTSSYQDYSVAPISGVVVQSYDGALTHTSGTITNPYMIQGNFLTYGLESADLMAIGANILAVVENIAYTPSSINMIGLPYLEVGDYLLVITPKGGADCYVMKRTMSGMASIADTCECQGNEYRQNETDLNKTIEQVTVDLAKTKITLQQTETGLATEISDRVAGETAASLALEATAQEIRAEFAEFQSEVDSDLSTITTNYQSAIAASAEELTATFSETYTSKLEFESLQVGYTNLLRDMEKARVGSDTQIYTKLSPFTVETRSTSSTVNTYMYTSEMESGETYVLQLMTDGDIYCGDESSSGTARNPRVNIILRLGYLINGNNINVAQTVMLPDGVTEVEGFEFIGDIDSGYGAWRFVNTWGYTCCELSVVVCSNGTALNSKSFWNFKLEMGTIPTSWGPSPEDQEAITNENISSTSYQITQEYQSAITASAQQIESTVKSTYATQASLGALESQVDGIEIGGRNMITKATVRGLTGGYMQNAGYYANWANRTTSGYGIVLQPHFASAQLWNSGYLENVLLPGKDYTLSFVAWNEGSDAGKIEVHVDLYPDNLPEFTFTPPKTVTRYSFLFNSESRDMLKCALRFFCNYEHAWSIAIADIKLEEGNQATAWSPAPEDQVAEAAADAATKYSTITQTDSKIALCVAKDSVISSINQSAEEITIDAEKVSLKGKTISLTSDDINISSTNFSVDSTGAMTCRNASVTGTVTATSGAIGGFNITDGNLFSDDGDTYFQIYKNGAIVSANYGGALQGSIRLANAEFTTLSAGGTDIVSSIATLTSEFSTASDALVDVAQDLYAVNSTVTNLTQNVIPQIWAAIYALQGR